MSVLTDPGNVYNPFPTGVPPTATGSPIPGTLDPTQIPGLPNIPGGSAGLQNLLSFLGIGGQVGAAALQQAQLNRAFDYLNQIGQTASGQNRSNLGNATGVFGQQGQGLSSILDGSNPWQQMLSQGLMGNIQTLNNLLPGLVQTGQNQAEFAGQPNNQIYGDPNMTAELRGITDLTGNTSGMLAKAAQLLNSGGITDSQSPLNSYAQQLMSGLNPNQQALQGAGTSILGAGGMTPALQQALQSAQGVVGSNGQTALNSTLAQRGLDLASGNPLLSGADAASIAQDQSGRNYANAAKTARSQAEARGNGPGAIVGNGIGNGTLADFSDQALSATAQAAQNARLGQQGLGLQQQAAGLNTALGAGQQQQGLELGGLGAITGLTGAQTGQLGVGGGLTNSAAQLGNQGAQFYNNLLGLQQGNMAQGFQAGQAGVQQQQGLLQAAITNLMNGQNNSAATGNSLANLYLGNQNQLGQGIGQGINSNLSALGQLGSQGQGWLNSAMSALGTYGNTGSSVSQLLQQPNQYSVLLNNFGAGAQGSGGNGAVNSGLAGLGAGIGSTLGKIILKNYGGNGSGFDLGGGGGFDLGGFSSGGGNDWLNSPFFTDPSYAGYDGKSFNGYNYAG